MLPLQYNVLIQSIFELDMLYYDLDCVDIILSFDFVPHTDCTNCTLSGVFNSLCSTFVFRFLGNPL